MKSASAKNRNDLSFFPDQPRINIDQRANRLHAFLGPAFVLAAQASAVFILGRNRARFRVWKQAEIHVHRLERRLAGQVPASDMLDQCAQRRGRRRRRERRAKPLSSGKPPGEQAHRGAFNIALDPGNLSGKTNARHRFQAEGSVE